MEEALRTWRLHYSICDAAYVALLDLIRRHHLSNSYAQTCSDDLGIDRETSALDGSAETQSFFTAPTDPLSHVLAAEQIQFDNVRKVHPFAAQ
jgi:hypothetical protein